MPVPEYVNNAPNIGRNLDISAGGNVGNKTFKCWSGKIKALKLEHPENICCAYLSINTVANKWDNFIGVINNNVDILCFAETKLDSSYPPGQFFIPGYASPYRLDISKHSGGLLVYIKENIPSLLLKKFKVLHDIQILPIELNFRKSKWLYLPLYRPDRTGKAEFLAAISDILDFYSTTHSNILINGDFNMEVTETLMAEFLKKHDLYSMIKTATCFKSKKGRCIDLCLTNKKYSFINTQTFETGFSDFHEMTYTMFKSTFVKLSPKVITYRSYKNCDKNKFHKELVGYIYIKRVYLITTSSNKFFSRH